MAVNNRVSAVVSDQDITDINTALNTILEKLPFLIDLSPEELKAIPRLGDKSVAFVTKALELVLQNSDFLPRKFNIDEFKKDVELYNKLYSLLQKFRMFIEKLEDTYVETGSEAYSSALIVYSSAKKARGDLAGLESVLDDLGKRFIQKSAAVEELQPK